MASYSENMQECLGLNGVRSAEMLDSFSDMRDASIGRAVLRAPTVSRETLWRDRASPEFRGKCCSSRAAPQLTQEPRILATESQPMLRLPTPQLAQNPLIQASRSVPQIVPPTYGQTTARAISSPLRSSMSPSMVQPARPPTVSGQQPIMAETSRRTWPQRLSQPISPRGPLELVVSTSAIDATSYSLNHSGSAGSSGLVGKSHSPSKPNSVQVPTPTGGYFGSSTPQAPAMQALESRFKDIVEAHVQELLSALEGSIEQHHADLFARMEQIEVRCGQQASGSKEPAALALLQQRLDDLAQEVERTSSARNEQNCTTRVLEAQQREVDGVRESQCQASGILSGVQQRIEELQLKCEALQSMLEDSLQRSQQNQQKALQSMLEDGLQRTQQEQQKVLVGVERGIVDVQLAIEQKVETIEQSLASLRTEMRTDVCNDIMREVRVGLQADVRESVQRNIADIHAGVARSVADVQESMVQMTDLRPEIYRIVEEVCAEFHQHIKTDLQRDLGDLEERMKEVCAAMSASPGMTDMYDALAQMRDDMQRHDSKLNNLREAGSDQNRNQIDTVAELKGKVAAIEKSLSGFQERLSKGTIKRDDDSKDTPPADFMNFDKGEADNSPWISADLPIRRKGDELADRKSTLEALRRSISLPSKTSQRKEVRRVSNESTGSATETPQETFGRLFNSVSYLIDKEPRMTAGERDKIRKRARSIASVRGGTMDFELEEMIFGGEKVQAGVDTERSLIWPANHAMLSRNGS